MCCSFSCRWWRWLPCLVLLLSGCSTPASSPPAAIRIRWAHDPESLDPLRLASPQAMEAFNLLHMGLLQLNYASRRFEPALAEGLPQVQLVGDSLSLLTYQLRPQAMWDHGRPVLAQDVAFTLKLMLTPGLPNEAAQARYGFVKDVQLDPANNRRLTFVCRGQAPDYVQATGSIAVLPEAYLDSAGVFRAHSVAALRLAAPGTPADAAIRQVVQRYEAANLAQHPERLPGSGPYQLSKWTRDRSLTFARKKKWWADALPAPQPTVLVAYPAQLRYEIVPDEAAASLALQRGELDLYPQLGARDFFRLQGSATARQHLAFYTASSHEIVTAGFNTRRPALADAATRRALRLLFNTEGLLKATQLGAGQRTVGLISPTDKVHYNDSLALPAYDPAAAAVALGRAGWRRSPSGWQRRLTASQPLEILRLVVRYRPDEVLFETIALQFREAASGIGIAVELRPTESAALNGVLRSGDFDVYLRTLKGSPFGFNFAPILHSRSVGEGNLTGFSTPASDALIDAIVAADTPTRQTQLLRRFQAFLQEQAPLVPLFMLPTRLVASRRLAGVSIYDLKPGYVATSLRWANPLPLATAP